jgi:hypothetical protein
MPPWTIVDVPGVEGVAGNRRRSRSVCATMNAVASLVRLAAGLLVVVSLLVACAGGAAAPSASPSQSPDAPVSAPPSDGTGGGASIDPGIGAGAKPVLPKPGQAINIHPIAAEQLAARVDGDRIIVKAVWYSGVEPCTILDSILVSKGEGTYTITLQEGSSPQEIACMAIAELHVTEFDIPNVPAGTWTIRDSGGLAAPVEVTVG